MHKADRGAWRRPPRSHSPPIGIPSKALICGQGRKPRPRNLTKSRTGFMILSNGSVSVIAAPVIRGDGGARSPRSEEHTSELQSLMRISYAVFCLKKKKTKKTKHITTKL